MYSSSKLSGILYIVCFFLFLLIFYSIIFSGSEKSSSDESPIEHFSIKISSPPDSSSFTFGEEIKIAASILNPENDNVSVEFYVNNILKYVDTSIPYEYQLSNLAYRIGKSSVKSIAKDTEGNVSSDSITISINSDSTPIYNVLIENIFPHDNNAFTQGLIYDNGFLYESTGLFGYSSLRKVELETGNVLNIRNISKEYFCEGITIWKNQIYQLTWMSQKGFIYQKDDFIQTGSFSYSSEQGWGLTNNGSKFIMSDGTSSIYLLNPDTFKIDTTINVTDNGNPIINLNELEFVDGDLFANVWKSKKIARISLKTGEVIGWIDLKTICDSQPYGVLNGIAYDKMQNRLFITGKKWKKLYEVSLIPRQN
jgi:glutamine cyclotransferase